MISTNSIETLPGTKVVDPDGDKVGTVQQVYVSDDGGQPLFVTVNTGLFGTKESFVPLDAADLDGDVLKVAYDKATIKGAPNVDADGAISDDEQGSIFDYYQGHANTNAGYTDAGTGSPTYDAGTTVNTSDTTTTGVTDAGYGTKDYDTTADRTADTGYDTSGPTTDEAMTRSEERLNVGVQQVETGRARLRKHVVTEQQTVTVPVTHEEVRIDREPITDANRGAAEAGPDLSEEEHEIVLTEERPVVTKETVPVERVRVSKEAETEQRQVTEDVRSEQIEVDGDGDGTNRR